MFGLRRHLGLLAVAWLCCQSAALLAVPGQLVRVALADGCDCPGGSAGDMCPMHRHGASSESGSCAMRGTCAPIDAALLSLAGGAGVLTAPVAVAAASLVTSLSWPEPSFASFYQPPSSPPPRS